jgi:hypothetical protein
VRQPHPKTRVLRPLLAGLLLLLFATAPLAAKDVPAPQAPAAAPEVHGRYEVRDGQRVLTLWGTPRERGFAQGYLLAEAIVDGLGHDFETSLRPLLPLYETVIKHVVVPRFAFSDRETEELKGVLAGMQARLPEERRRVAALGHPLDLEDLKALNTFGDWYGLGCSSLAVWGKLTKDGRILVGRNFDFPGFDLLLEHQVVVVRKAQGDAQGSVGVSYPGCIGTLTGMNAAGVFVAVHDVRVKPSLDKALRHNVPRLLAVRRILERTKGAHACEQARDLARTWPTLYGNNLMVVAPEAAPGVPRAAVLEYDGRRDIEDGCTMRVSDHAETLPAAGLPLACLACTNYHRCRQETSGEDDGLPHWRYRTLCDLQGQDRPDHPFDVPGLFAWMVRASFPRDGSPQRRAQGLHGKARAHGTLHEVVAEPEARRLHVRLAQVGKSIRDIPPHTYDVAALLH